MVSCRFLPHGGYSLVPAVLTTFGWIASLLEDGCNYSLVTGDVIQTDLPFLVDDYVASDDEGASTVVKWIEVGFLGFRIPDFEPSTESWAVDYRGECIAFPTGGNSGYNDFFVIDGKWKFARLCSFLALVLGGGATFFLWISTCC
jgi:hypothetical protein